jgi:hypothetical protein
MMTWILMTMVVDVTTFFLRHKYSSIWIKVKTMVEFIENGTSFNSTDRNQSLFVGITS